MAKKTLSPSPLVLLRDSIERAARSEGLSGVEPFRAKHDLPNTTFYRLLRGHQPAKVATQKELRARLEAAGVRVPRELLSA